MTESSLVSIASDALSAEIDLLGAQLFALRDAEGRDLLWDGDPAIWTGRAPILFPIVGAVNGGAYRVGSQVYHLPRHGLARRKPFTVVAQDPTAVTLRLRWDEETLAIYPFHFQLDMTFALDGATLSMSAAISNLGQDPLPASFGYHPAFRWPLPYGAARADHSLRFERPEPAPVRRVDADGLIKPETFSTPVAGQDLALNDSLFVDDALILDQLHSGAVTFGPPAGPQLRVGFEGAPYLGLWSKPGAPFLCIEPWWGHADPQGFDGEIWDKPGVFVLARGETRALVTTVELTSAA